MTHKTDSNKIFVIDVSNYLFRSYFAIRKMTNQKGVSTNALFGFIRSIQKLIKDFNPSHLVCVFDGPNNKKSRTDIYKDYKAHRTGMPEDLFPQIAFAKTYLDYAGIPHLQVEEVEADDTIGSIAKWGEREGITTYLCSSDKDLCQLISDKVFVLNTFKENLIIDRKGVESIYGIKPEQIVDYLAIMGDASDNIPGVTGCGPKTATELLQKHSSLTAILERPEILDSKKLLAKFQAERENALISQRLATIKTDVPIPSNFDFYEIKQPNISSLQEFFTEMEFKTLIPLPVEKTESFIRIESEEALKIAIAELSLEKELVIITEATSLEPMQAGVAAINIGKSKERMYYIQTAEPSMLTLLKPLLENPLISYIGHNIKFTMHSLLNSGIALSNIYFDTMIAAQLLNAHNISESKKSQNAFEIIEWKKQFETELKDRSLWKLFTEMEMPLLPILFRMERCGIYVDKEDLSKLSIEFHTDLKILIQKIYDLSGEEFNINSPKQLSVILFDKLMIPSPGKKTQSGYSTNAEVLESLSGSYPIIDLILEYRTLEKLRSTYIDALPEQINAKTGRIHSTFNQSGTATGRLSSTNPNLQNIPIRKKEGKRIREAFKSAPGYSFIAADYSQIELRLLAHFCEDPHLIAAFKNNEDIHKSCASMVFGIPLNEVTDEMRSKAKAVNFGLIYGQQAFGLSKQLGISVKEASSFIEIYFKQYPTVKRFLETCKEDARRDGCARTLFDRKRLLPDILSKNGMLKSAAERLAVNTPLQGTQADIIKIAMIRIDNKLIEMKNTASMVLQIHDELIFECKDSDLISTSEIIREVMESVTPLKVPLRVDISFGKNWGEC